MQTAVGSVTGWTCDRCGMPVGGTFGDGCVEIAYWPAAPVDGVTTPGVQFAVHHTACDRPGAAAPVSYLVGCARVQTPAAWASCIARTAEHAWMTKDDVVAMVEFWFESRGERLPDVLDAPDPTMRRAP